MSDKVKVALKWLKGLLDAEGVEYQIVGGLAATIHGGSREIADIDLYIRNSDASKVLARVSQFVSKPLTHYAECGWDLEYFQLVYQNQKIEIGLSQNTKIQSALDGSWHDFLYVELVNAQQFSSSIKKKPGGRVNCSFVVTS